VVEADHVLAAGLDHRRERGPEQGSRRDGEVVLEENDPVGALLLGELEPRGPAATSPDGEVRLLFLDDEGHGHDAERLAHASEGRHAIGEVRGVREDDDEAHGLASSVSAWCHPNSHVAQSSPYIMSAAKRYPAK